MGEQQRVGIARAIVSKPPLLVADEPTGNLDATLAAEVMGLFRRFNEVGVTVVVATHDLHLVRASGLREIVLEDGRLTPPLPRCRHCDSARPWPAVSPTGARAMDTRWCPPPAIWRAMALATVLTVL